VALVEASHPETRFQFNWLPYFLNPNTPPEGEPYRAFLEAKFGGTAAVDKLHSDVVAAGGRRGSNSTSHASSPARTRCAHTAWSIAPNRSVIGQRPSKRWSMACSWPTSSVAKISATSRRWPRIAAACGDIKKDVADYLASTEGEKPVRSLADKVTALGVSGVLRHHSHHLLPI
jgi:hypothetical protein